jgi:hypothetical protein
MIAGRMVLAELSGQLGAVVVASKPAEFLISDRSLPAAGCGINPDQSLALILRRRARLF